MTRHPDWLQRLMDLEARYRHAPIDYRTHDCGRFAARVVDALLGTDHASRLTYQGPREAVLYLRANGGLGAVVTSFVGQMLRGAPCRRGDIGQVGRNALVVCFGAQTLAITQVGLHTIERERVCPWHWSVG